MNDPGTIPPPPENQPPGWAPSQPAAKAGMSRNKKIGLFSCGGCGGLLVLFIIIGVAAGTGTKNSNTAGSPVAQATSPHSTSKATPTSNPTQTATPTPKPTATPTPKPTAPTLTEQQQNAATAAQQYLSTQGFSKQGLIDQLDSSAGDGYSVHDATVAVDSLTVDWNAEAVQVAKAYLATQPFSCNALIQQLDSSAGDKFTVAQATYGAKQAGAC